MYQGLHDIYMTRSFDLVSRGKLIKTSPKLARRSNAADLFSDQGLANLVRLVGLALQIDGGTENMRDSIKTERVQVMSEQFHFVDRPSIERDFDFSQTKKFKRKERGKKVPTPKIEDINKLVQ